MNRLRFFCLFSVVLFISFAAPSVIAQSSHRDYMTDDEIELVRDAQDIDLRVDVLIKMLDRRFAVLKVNVGGAAIPSKETDKWGAAPKGSQMEILDDIRKLLEKAIDDIDNVASHPVNYDVAGARSDKQKKKDSLRFPDSVRNLAAAAKRYQPALKTLLDESKDEREKGLILNALESCDEIMAATTKAAGQTKDN